MRAFLYCVQKLLYDHNVWPDGLFRLQDHRSVSGGKSKTARIDVPRILMIVIIVHAGAIMGRMVRQTGREMGVNDGSSAMSRMHVFELRHTQSLREGETCCNRCNTTHRASV